MPRPTDEATTRSAAADSACLGSGSTTRHRFTACTGRLSAAVGTGRARCLWKAVTVCWADTLPLQHPRQIGRSDLCSRHQRGNPGRSAWCVDRVTQPCRISQVCRHLARDAGLVALATAHASPDLSLTVVTWIQRLLGHAAWLCFSQTSSQQLKRQQCTPASKSSRLEPVVCDCALTGNVPSTRAGGEADVMHG